MSMSSHNCNFSFAVENTAKNMLTGVGFFFAFQEEHIYGSRTCSFSLMAFKGG